MTSIAFTLWNNVIVFYFDDFVFSSIQSYKVAAGFDFLAFLQCVGHFFTVFFGAFALGSGMGCVTAVVSFCL